MSHWRVKETLQVMCNTELVYSYAMVKSKGNAGKQMRAFLPAMHITAAYLLLSSGEAVS